MPIINVNVKYGKEKHKVEYDVEGEVDMFKASLFSITGVSPENQKLMASGKVLNDTFDNCVIKNNMTMMLLGTVTVPSEDKVEKEENVMEKENDISMEIATPDIYVPTGLNNLGNSCYINATFQCLKSILEMKYLCQADTSRNNIFGTFTDLMVKMDMEDLSTFNPFIFTSMVRQLPQFDQLTSQGQYAQQDANECWIELLNKISHAELNEEYFKGKPRQPVKFVKNFMTLEFQTEIKPIIPETFDGGPELLEKLKDNVTYSNESVMQISCFIEKEMRYMESGIQKGMQEEITKFCEIADKDMTFLKKSVIARAPGYLTIHLVRFFYKGGKEVNAKIMKEIKYPMELDVYNYCSSQLQEKMIPFRQKLKDQSDNKSAYDKELKQLQFRNPGLAATIIARNNDILNTEYESYSFDDDIGSNNSGIYELQAVLTHQGRLSKSGHYIGWVKTAEGVWFKCDDDVVTACTEEEILKLAGGGDWHTAYILLYGPKKYRKTPLVSISDL